MLSLSMTELIDTHTANTKASASLDEQPENIGIALTVLGLEDKFLSNGELAKFPLMQRGRMTNGIISKKLALGRWVSVVELIYGESGKADALYDGDREKLKAEIIETAKREPEHWNYSQAIRALAEKKEDGLIFGLALALPLKYEDFSATIRGIRSEFFDDPDEGAGRKQTYHRAAAQKALKEKRDSDAFAHFKSINDETGMAAVFDSFIAGHEGCFNYNHSLSDAETFAESSDPKVKESRLKKLVSIACSAKNRCSSNSLYALDMVKRNNLGLSDAEKKRLYDAVSEASDASELLRKSGDRDPELLLMWAKKHVTRDPLHAYGVFESQKYQGEEVLQAVKAALTSKDGQRRSLDEQSPVSHFSNEHLNAVYAELPFDTRMSIAFHLKDTKKFQALSKEASKAADFDQAYRLWGYGEGNLNGDYAFKLREKLINDAIADGHKWFYPQNDASGETQAYVAFMAAGNKTNNPSYFKTAYDHARRMNDEPSTQAARVRMVEHSPIWALGIFESSDHRHEPDQIGVDYVLGVVGKQTGVAPEKLRAYLDKYSKQEKR